MAYKRNIDRLPIPPKDAKVQSVTGVFIPSRARKQMPRGIEQVARCFRCA